VEVAEVHGRCGVAYDLAAVVDDAVPGVEHTGRATHAAQPCAGFVGVSGFAVRFTVQVEYGVAAHHHGLGADAVDDRSGLVRRERRCHGDGVRFGDRRLVEPGHDHLGLDTGRSQCRQACG